MPGRLRLASSLRGPTAWLAQWPNRCAVCHADTRGSAGRVCGACLVRFAAAVPRCPRCALRSVTAGLPCGRCLREPPPWASAVAACDYGYPWDGLLGDFKFHAALDLAPALAALLAERIPPAQAKPDLLLPVPLADARLRERGYNQAALLAAQLARRLRLTHADDVLRRIADTPHQLALPRARRAANVRGAFALAPRAHGLPRDRHIALLDDVMTTGATCGELARLLLEAGAASVRVWVMARTPAA